jgi:hypothetical protein
MFKSFGTNPDFLYFGGNSEMRGYEYLQFLGHEAFFANVELRYPLVEAMLTPFGVLGGLRGVFFFDIGGGGFNNQPFNAFDHGTKNIPLLLGYTSDFFGNPVPVFGPDIPVNGFRLVDSQASHGVGIQTAVLGFRSLRLGVENPLQPALRRRDLFLSGEPDRPDGPGARQRPLPEGQVPVLDWVRLLRCAS